MSDLDDDVEWVVPGNSTVSGTYRGKAEVTELFAKVAEQSFTTTPSRFLADDDVVVVLTQVTAGGESAPQADVVTFRDGKIVKAQSLRGHCHGGTGLRHEVVEGPDPVPGAAGGAAPPPRRLPGRNPFPLGLSRSGG